MPVESEPVEENKTEVPNKDVPESNPAESEDWLEGEPTKEEEKEDELAKFSGIDTADDTARIEVLQADPSTPYHSATTFEEMGLREELMKGIYDMGFSKPSKIQATSIPMILSADGEFKNLIAQAHNGSGKTASFVLGMLSRIDFNLNETQVLCLVPTRELARQIEEIIQSIGKFTSVKTKLAVKATDEEKRQWRTDAPRGTLTEHVVVGTPGKVMEFIKKRMMNTKTIKMLVLDEADEMVDSQAMGDQTIRIKRLLPRNIQVLLFSATYRDAVRGFASKIAPNANEITIKRETLSLEKVKQYYLDTNSKHERFQVLVELYEALSLGQSIIFVRTRSEAASLTERLREDGHTVSVLYGGDMTPEERDRVIDEFRSGVTKVLVTTNVLSRGVDVLAVSCVINYDLPTDRSGLMADPETYLHRIGRTGRFGRKGIAINLVYDDRSKSVLKELEDYYAKKIEAIDDVETLATRIREL